VISKKEYSFIGFKTLLKIFPKKALPRARPAINAAITATTEFVVLPKISRSCLDQIISYISPEKPEKKNKIVSNL
jgi:hypothetical protein